MTTLRISEGLGSNEGKEGNLKRIGQMIALFMTMTIVAAQTAAAGGTQSGGYPRGGVGGDAEGQVSGFGQAGGQLPFTGLNLVLLIVGGALLLALGLVMVRRNRPSS